MADDVDLMPAIVAELMAALDLSLARTAIESERQSALVQPHGDELVRGRWIGH